ncbi:MAG TPA: hypothetical protein VNS55_12915 [Nocardioides sp.]|nr:hypothetical protein [Nocardioides sp.]
MTLVPLALLAGPSIPANAGPPSCHGKAATVVGEPGSVVDGTDSADVVVTNGATRVSTGAGDDLVCVTGGTDVDVVDVDTQNGSDLVDTRGSRAGVARVDLGHGDDTFDGGSRPDTVYASNAFGTPGGRGADVVSTGGGRDVVFTGAWFGNPDHDAVDLGAGRDDLWLQGAVDPGLPVVGGAGSDGLLFDRISLRHQLVIDNASGRAVDAGTAVMTWSGIERFELSAVGPWQPPSFVGGPGPERVRSGLPLTSVTLGGGDDLMDLETEGRFVDDATYRGGQGDDVLRFYSGPGDQVRRERLDLPEKRLVVVQDGERTHARVAGFDLHRLSAARLVVRGTMASDHVRWSGCHGRVEGRGGDDLLEAIDVVDAGCGPDADLVTRGGRGDDVLVGSDYRSDLLLGGSGADSADGRGADDRCVAETVRRCER